MVGSLALTECMPLRYDRVLWKSAGGQWRPKRIELFGTAPMKGHIVRSSLPLSWVTHDRQSQFCAHAQGVWPSDHFGLVTDLEFVAQAEPEPELADE
jgi:hypothetical protein